jgi:CheY-like chemotaxis protein
MVDDEPELVQATVALLTRELGDTQVRGSTDPREVVDWIEAQKPGALITDVRMPHLNGLELVTRLHQKWGPVPVVVITAFPTAQVDQQASAGRFAYLPKPFTFRSLRETLARICSQPAPSAFSGAIAVSMLGEVVQLYGLANRTGTLQVVSNQGVGDIGFDSGRVVDARTGEMIGVDAFNTILGWSSGSFGWHGGIPEQHTINVGLSELLLEAYRQRDERDAGITNKSTSEIHDDPFSDLDQALSMIEDMPVAEGNNVQANLSKLERAEGFLGAAVFDIRSDTCVASVDRKTGLDVSAAAIGHADVVRAKQETISRLNLNDTLEDIVISQTREYHLLRLCRRQPSLFVYLLLDRAKANLAMARHLLSDVERDMVL